jgi:dihydroorotate dehydrogenase electron transfer subunit
MRQTLAEVLYNHSIGPSYYRLGLSPEEDLGVILPGQFVMLQLGQRKDLLLRRPFSVGGLMADGGAPAGIELLYKVVGKGTRVLSECAQGARLDVLGPLGNGFRIDAGKRHVYLAAGGIGVAPIRFLAQHLRRLGTDLSGCRVFLGGRTRDDLICRPDFEQLGLAVTLTTDDGSVGDRCLITDPLEMAVSDLRPDMIYACGPMPMLACIAGIAERHQTACQVSIETMMACGMGACLGCAVETRKGDAGYLHACVDGPVFDIHALRF